MHVPGRPVVIALAAAGILLAAGIGWAAIPDSTGAVNACAATADGALRAVDEPADCTTDETALELGGPTRGYAFADPSALELGPASIVVGSLELAPGSYLAHGKVNVVNLDFTSRRGTFVPCSLKVEGTTTNLDQTWVVLEQAITGSAASSASIGLQAAIQLPNGGSLAMQCASVPRAGGPSSRVFARFRQLDALQVDNLTTSP